MTIASPRGTARTSLHIDAGEVEIIQGGIFPWRFRPHYHFGQEVVRLLQGRARLRLRGTVRDVVAGETIMVPAKTVHRFEPVDAIGWAFASRFVRQETRAPDVIEAYRGSLSARVIDILVTRPSLHSGIEEIAACCSLSTGYVARVFRQETGTNLHHFHVLVGLHKAKALLRDGRRVVEAALEAGFCDQAHLTREFVKTFGMTPGAFRSAWTRARPVTPSKRLGRPGGQSSSAR